MEQLEWLNDALLVVAGGAIAIAADWLRGRRERTNKRAELLTARAEELCALCVSLVDWSKRAFMEALDGRFDPMPMGLLRVQTLVAGYTPEFQTEAGRLFKAAADVQDACNTLSAAARKSPPPSGAPPLSEAERVRMACCELIGAAVDFNETVGKRLREINAI